MSDTGESRQSFIRVTVSCRTFLCPLVVIAFRSILIGRQMLEDNAGQYMYMYLGSDLTIIAACSNIIR